LRVTQGKYDVQRVELGCYPCTVSLLAGEHLDQLVQGG
jgi:hypothetical protein